MSMHPPRAISLHIVPTPDERGDEVGHTIQTSTSHDLVFAVIGHAGAGATYVATALLEDLKSKQQDARFIKMSELIATAAQKLDGGRWSLLSSGRGLARTRALQDAGNWLRDTKGPAFTAGLAVRHMHEERSRSADAKRPMAFVIDSLKNKSEVDALRKVYGRSFYLISVVCGPEARRARLKMKYKGESEANLDKLASRDEDETEAKGFGQQVRRTIHHGDFFVNNEESSLTSGPSVLAQALSRFLQVVFGTDIVRPTRDERGMYAAWSAGLRSSCMSRQVGAAILSSAGQLISTGTNDVPKFGGGLGEEGASPDYRCFKYEGYCRNDRTKDEIYNKVVSCLQEVLKEGVSAAAVRKQIETTPIADLVEFSRAVHAEMDAIVALARSGAASASGGTLYCTTYPCHSCARHIVAAGIRDVIYIEPYIKSRAATLHADSILETTKEPDDKSERVHFRLFTGVAPRRFAALFEKRAELKHAGRRVLPDEEDALHQDPVFTKSHVDFEKSISMRVSEVEAGDGRAR